MNIETLLTASDVAALADLRKHTLVDNLTVAIAGFRKVLDDPAAHMLPVTDEKLAAWRVYMDANGSIVGLRVPYTTKNNEKWVYYSPKAFDVVIESIKKLRHLPKMAEFLDIVTRVRAAVMEIDRDNRATYSIFTSAEYTNMSKLIEMLGGTTLDDETTLLETILENPDKHATCDKRRHDGVHLHLEPTCYTLDNIDEILPVIENLTHLAKIAKYHGLILKARAVLVELNTPKPVAEAAAAAAAGADFDSCFE